MLFRFCRSLEEVGAEALRDLGPPVFSVACRAWNFQAPFICLAIRGDVSPKMFNKRANGDQR